MARRLFTLLSALSLFLCVAFGAAWLLGDRLPGLTSGTLLRIPAPSGRDGGWVVRVRDGRLVLARRPPFGPADPVARAAAAGELRDGWLAFSHHRSDRDTGPTRYYDTAYGGAGLSRLLDRPAAADVAPLVALLDDPSAFLRAHVALTRRAGDGLLVIGDVRVPPGPGFALVGEVNGVRVGMRRTTDPWAVELDPTQAPAVAAWWRDRLARPAVAVPLGPAALAAAVLPSLWAAAWIRRRAGRRAIGFPVDAPAGRSGGNVS